MSKSYQPRDFDKFESRARRNTKLSRRDNKRNWDRLESNPLEAYDRDRYNDNGLDYDQERQSA